MVDSLLLEEYFLELLPLDKKLELWEVNTHQGKKMICMKKPFKEQF
jgi:hypothetical protein